MLVRTVLFPVRLVLGVGKLSAKGGYRAGRASLVGPYRVGRAIGYGRIAALGVGVAVGMLCAPSSGPELRAQLRRRWDERNGPGSDDEIAERVRYELAHSPRTWHLPQPEVEVVAGTAVLTGTAPHATGSEDLERAAAAVAGVATVDNRLVLGAE